MLVCDNMEQPLRRRPTAAERSRFAMYIRETRGERPVRVVVAASGQTTSWYRWIEAGARSSIGPQELKILAIGLGVEPQDVFRKAREAGY